MPTEQKTDRAALAQQMVDEWLAAKPQPPITDLLVRYGDALAASASTDRAVLVHRVREAADRADQCVSDINNGRKRWALSIPARLDEDADLIFSGLARVAREAAAALAAPVVPPVVPTAAAPTSLQYSPLAAVPCSVPVRGRWIEFVAIDNHTGGGVEARMLEALVTLFAGSTPDGVEHLIAAKVFAEMRSVLGMPVRAPAIERSEVRF